MEARCDSLLGIAVGFTVGLRRAACLSDVATLWPCLSDAGILRFLCTISPTPQVWLLVWLPPTLTEANRFDETLSFAIYRSCDGFSVVIPATMAVTMTTTLNSPSRPPHPSPPHFSIFFAVPRCFGSDVPH